MWQWQPQWNKGAPSKPGKWLVRTKTGDEGVAIIYEDVRDEEDTDTKYLRFEMDGDSAPLDDPYCQVKFVKYYLGPLPEFLPKE